MFGVVFVCLSLVILTDCYVPQTITFPKNIAERVTSFVVVNNTVYLTYLDLHKASGSNGQVKYFNMLKTPINNQDLQSLNINDLISPIAIRLDDCHRLWILDSGVQDIGGLQDKSIPPSIFVYHLHKKIAEKIYQVPKHYIKADTFFSNLVIDIGKTCNSSFVYMADFNERRLFVYDTENNIGKVLSHHFFNPDPQSNITTKILYNVNKMTVSGLCGLEIIGKYLFYHALASKNDFVLLTANLRDRTYTKINYNDSHLVLQRKSEAGVMQFDKNNSVVFYALFKKIGCLKITKDYEFDVKLYNEIDVNITEGFITGVHVVGPNLFILVNSETNFEIIVKNIQELIKNTSCGSGFSNSINMTTRTLVSDHENGTEFDYELGGSSSAIQVSISTEKSIFLVLIFFTFQKIFI